jgi:hypothetical protein
VNSSFAFVEKRYLDKKEVSFSHRLSDDQTSTDSDKKSVIKGEVLHTDL